MTYKTKIATMIDNNEIDTSAVLRNIIVNFLDETDVKKVYEFLEREGMIIDLDEEE